MVVQSTGVPLVQCLILLLYGSVLVWVGSLGTSNWKIWKQVRWSTFINWIAFSFVECSGLTRTAHSPGLSPGQSPCEPSDRKDHSVCSHVFVSGPRPHDRQCSGVQRAFCHPSGKWNVHWTGNWLVHFDFEFRGEVYSITSTALTVKKATEVV